MIIECTTCNSRFRLDESKITGKGARVRCRKCGEAITVMKEDVDGQAGAGTAAPGAQEDGLDLRSILRETMESPEPPAARSAGVEALQSDLDKMLAGAATEPAAPERPRPAPQAPAGGQSVEFGPEEEITFLKPGGAESPAATAKEAPAAPKEPAPPAADPKAQPEAQASSSEFVMSTADALDFLKADYDQSGQKAALDISGSLRAAPAPGAEAPKVAPPLGTQTLRAPEPPAAAPPRYESLQSELASMAGTAGAAAAGATAPKAPPSAASAAPAAAPKAASPAAKTPPAAPKAASPPPPVPRAAAPSAPVRKTPGKKATLKRRQSSQLVRPSLVLLLLLFLALAGGGAYLGFTTDGKRVLRDLVPQIESFLPGGSAKPTTRFGVANLAGYYETGAASSKMFVIKGQVTNEGMAHKVGVRVSATIFDAQGRKLSEKTVYAGNVLAGETLRQAPRERIETAMSNPVSGGLAGIDLPPGKSVQFMVVFFDAPDGIDSYRVEPRDVD